GLGILRRQPLDKAREGLNIHTRRRIGLAWCETVELHRIRRYLEDHETCPETLAFWDVLARRQQQPAGRFGRTQGGIGAHPLPPTVIGLCSKESLCGAI